MEGRIGIGIGIDPGRSDRGSDRIEGSTGSQGSLADPGSANLQNGFFWEKIRKIQEKQQK